MSKILEGKKVSSPASGHLARGKELMQAGQLEEAVTAFEQALRENPDSPMAHMALGVAYQRLQNHDKALEHLQAAESLDSRFARARSMRTRILLNQGDVDGALTEFEDQIEQNPNSEAAHIQVSRLYLKQKRYDEALVHVKEALRFNPQNAAARMMLADIHVRQHAYDKALKELKRVERDAPDHPRLKIKTGQVYVKLRQYDKAIPVFEELFLEHPGNSAIQLALGRSYLHADKLEEAMAVAMDLIRRKESLFQARLLAGDILQAQGMYEDALEEYEAILANDPNLVDQYPELAELEHSDLADEARAKAFARILDKVAEERLESRRESEASEQGNLPGLRGKLLSRLRQRFQNNS